MRKNFLHQLGFVTLTAFALLITLSSDANAQNRSYRYDPYYDNAYGTRYENNSRYYSAAWENGYRLGYGSGSNDRSYRSSYDVDRNKTYRDADSGYRGEYGSKDQYKREFRDAYESGYRDGYDGRRSLLDVSINNNRRSDRYYDRQIYRNNRYPSQSCPPRRGRGWGRF